MKKGQWMPIDINLKDALPRHGSRPYTLLEAAFSYQLDLKNETVKAFREYERMWSWSLKKVMNFIRNEQGTKTEQARNTCDVVSFRFIKDFSDNRPLAGDKQETKTEQAGDTTIIIKNISNKTATPCPPEYLAYFEVLKSIPGYPFDPEKDFAFLQEKETEFPTVDIEALLKSWKVYILDVPFKKKSSPRSQLNNQFKFAVGRRSCLKTPAQAEAGGVNMLDLITVGAAEREDFF